VETLDVLPDHLRLLPDHLRLVTSDGNFEFEHSTGTATSLLNSYYLGTPTRTPIAVSAIDGRGRLRIGDVTLTTRRVKGKAELLAVLPGGKTEQLAAARSLM
jgi:hypothetical protein